MTDFENKLDRKLATVEVVRNVRSIDNADSLELVDIKGWEVVVKKGEFKDGDLCIYVEIDSILPEMECYKFMESKKYRIKTVKLRGQISQGICFPLSIINNYSDYFILYNPDFISGSFIHKKSNNNFIKIEEGLDLTEILQIKKYLQPSISLKAGDSAGNFPSNINKTDEERFQNCFNEIKRIYEEESLEPDDLVARIKYDGSSMTVYYDLEKDKFGVCSRNLELKESDSRFWQVAKQYNLHETLPLYCRENNISIAIQGELIGEGVQGNPHKIQGNQFKVFDAQNLNNKYFSNRTLKTLCKELNLEIADEVPIPDDFEFTKEHLIKLSKVKGSQCQWLEGVVIRLKYSTLEKLKGTSHGRFSFKVINPEYLLKNNH